MSDARRAALYEKWVHPGDLVFDNGANIGNRARVFARLGARVVAVEPQPHCYTALRWVFKFNPNVTVIRAAASFDNTPQLITEFETDILSTLSQKFSSVLESGTRFGTPKPIAKFKVPCVTLDELVHKYGTPVFTKIDVEGYEPEVLAGLTKPAGTVSFEVTPELPEQAEQCLARLEALGYQRFQLSLNESMQLLSSWLDAASMRERLADFVKYKTDFGDVYALAPD